MRPRVVVNRYRKLSANAVDWVYFAMCLVATPLLRRASLVCYNILHVCYNIVHALRREQKQSPPRQGGSTQRWCILIQIVMH